MAAKAAKMATKIAVKITSLPFVGHCLSLDTDFGSVSTCVWPWIPLVTFTNSLEHVCAKIHLIHN
jgi:hypothetical protein